MTNITKALTEAYNSMKVNPLVENEEEIEIKEKPEEVEETEEINEEDIRVKDVSATSVTVQYLDLEIHFDKHQLMHELKVKCNLFEDAVNPSIEETDSLPKEEADEDALGDNNTNPIKRFNDIFRLNRVVQLKNLKSYDDYRHEHAIGDIYKIQ